MRDRRQQAVRVLVMSEYPVVRAGLRRLLEAPGVRVVGEAAGARQALDLLARRRSDLLLVACHGEECELVRLAKERRPQVAVLLVAMSDRSLPVSRAVALGCSGYLPRTVSRAELLRAIRLIARGEWALEPALVSDLVRELASQGAGARTPPVEALTASERDVLRLVTEGRTNRQIAHQLRYSVGTVKDYVQKIIRKLEVSDRTQAAVQAVRRGLLD